MAFKGGKKLVARSPSPSAAQVSSKKSSSAVHSASPHLKQCTGIGLANGSSPQKGDSIANANAHSHADSNKKKDTCRYESMHPNNNSTAGKPKKKPPEKSSRDFNHRGRNYDESADSAALSKGEELQEVCGKKISKGSYRQSSSSSSDSDSLQTNPSKILSKRTKLPESEMENAAAWLPSNETGHDPRATGFESVNKTSHLDVMSNHLEMEEANHGDDDECDSLHSIHTPSSIHSSIEEKWDYIIDKNVNSPPETQIGNEEENVSSLISKWGSPGRTSPMGRTQNQNLAPNNLTTSIDTEITRATGELMLCRVNGQEVKMRKNKVFQPFGKESRNIAECDSHEDHSPQQQGQLVTSINQNAADPGVPSHDTLHEKSCRSSGTESELNVKHTRKSESSYYPHFRTSTLVQNGNISEAWPKENNELRENSSGQEAYQPFERDINFSSDHDQSLSGDGTGSEIAEAQSQEISDQSDSNFDLEHCDLPSDTINTPNTRQWPRFSDKINSILKGHSLSLAKATNMNTSQQRLSLFNDETKQETRDKHEDTTICDYDPPVNTSNSSSDITVSDSRFSESEHKYMTQDMSEDDIEEETFGKMNSSCKEIQRDLEDVATQGDTIVGVTEGMLEEDEQALDQGKNNADVILPHVVLKNGSLTDAQEQITGNIEMSDEVNSSDSKKMILLESQCTPKSNSETKINDDGIDMLMDEENMRSMDQKSPHRASDFINCGKGEVSDTGASPLSIVERLTTSESGRFSNALERCPTFSLKNLGHTSCLQTDLIKNGYCSAVENKEVSGSSSVKKPSLPFDSGTSAPNPADRSSLSAEKLSSILSYLEQVEANSLQETCNLFPHSSSFKGRMAPSGNCSPRAVLEREDSISVSDSSFTLSSTAQNVLPNDSNLASSEREWRLMTSSPNVAASVFQGIRRKMQELKDRIASHEACIIKLESEKEHLRTDKERELSSERERFVTELKNQSAEYKAAIQHHLSLNERMLKDKEELSVKCSTLASNIALAESKFEQKLTTLKEQWSQDVKKQKELWSIAEKSKRESWFEKKTKEIKEATIVGIEPYIEAIREQHKQEIQKLEAKHAGICDRLQKERDELVQKEQLAAESKIKEMAERWIHERPKEIEELIERIKKEKDEEIAQVENEKDTQVTELLEEKFSLHKKLKDTEDLWKTSLEEKKKVESELMELRKQIAQEKHNQRVQEENFEQRLRQQEEQLQKSIAEVQEVRARKIEELEEVDARMRQTMERKDFVIGRLRDQLYSAQEQIRNTELLLQQEHNAIFSTSQHMC